MIAEFVPGQSGNRLEVLKCSSSQRSRYFGSISKTAEPIQHFNKIERSAMTMIFKKSIQIGGGPRLTSEVGLGTNTPKKWV